MTASVRPMTDDEYTAFAARSLAEFAADLAHAASLPPATAHERAVTLFAESLPDGRSTVGHRLLAVLDGERVVGQLWIGPHPQRDDAAFVYDITIEEPERGHGFGRDALLAADEFAKADGLAAIGLNVFGFNENAQRLYSSVGYDVISTQMLKKLD